MKTPSWEDVGVPRVIVEHVKQLKPSFTLDTLVYQLVYHNNKRLFVTYLCDACTNVHKGARSNEEVGVCVACGSKRVRCVSALKFNKDIKLPFYSRKGNYLSSIMTQMSDNFTRYFRERPERNLDWEWSNDTYHVAFAGGETAKGAYPRAAVAKAALLVPYLWDTGYDWKNDTRLDSVDRTFITPLLGHLLPRKS